MFLLLANSSKNLFASEITSNSTQLLVESFESIPGDNGTAICSVDQLQLKRTLERLTYVEIFYNSEDISREDSTELIDATSSHRAENLRAGLLYKFEFAPIDSCSQEVVTNLTLTNSVPTGKNF